LHWETEAEEVIKKVPGLVRGLVRKKVEEFAQWRGEPRVTREIVEQARSELGRRGRIGAAREPDQAEVERLERELSRVREGKYKTRYYEVQVCAGAVGCPRSLIPVAEMADALVEVIEGSQFPAHLAEGRRGRPVLSHHRFKAAVAGCPNACSQPQIQDFGVVGKAQIFVLPERCNHCGQCVAVCQESAIALSENGPGINRERCLGCGDCVRVCPTEALTSQQTGYQVLAGGRLGRHPCLAKEVLALAAREEVMAALSRSLELLMCEGQPGERLAAIVEKRGFLFPRSPVEEDGVQS